MKYEAPSPLTSPCSGVRSVYSVSLSVGATPGQVSGSGRKPIVEPDPIPGTGPSTLARTKASYAHDRATARGSAAKGPPPPTAASSAAAPPGALPAAASAAAMAAAQAGHGSTSSTRPWSTATAPAAKAKVTKPRSE